MHRIKDSGWTEGARKKSFDGEKEFMIPTTPHETQIELINIGRQKKGEFEFYLFDEAPDALSIIAQHIEFAA
jgi:hypothetical protein